MTQANQNGRVERAALEVWHIRFGDEPTEPLREKGGALDLDGWCMAVALAVATDRPLPPRSKDVPTRADDPEVRAARAVLGK